MQFKYKLLPFFVTAAMAAAGGNVVAAPLQGQEASTAWSFGGAPLPAPQAVDTAAGFPGSVDVIPSDTGPVPFSYSDIFAHSYGSVGEPGVGTVSFGSRASGTGFFDITSQYNLRGYQFTVPGAGGLVDVYFSFVIDYGELAIYCGDCEGGSASLLIDIGVGTTVDGPRSDPAGGGDGAANLVMDQGTWTLATSGIASTLGDLAGAPSSGSGAVQFNWNATPFNVLLGSYAPGTTLFLDYDLITSASGRFTSDDAYGYAGGSFCNTEIPQDDQIALQAFVEEPTGVCYDYIGNAISRAGDPFPNSNAVSVGFNTPTGVPEPGSMALVGAGLAAAFAARRRKGAKKS